MTAEEKAHELFDKYNELLSFHIFNGNFDVSKQCALIAVDEIINSVVIIDLTVAENQFNYWEEVKQELLKL